MKGRLERKTGMAAPLPTKKEKKPIAKKSEKKLAEEKKEKEQRDGDTDLIKWHKARIKYGSPVCEETGMKVERNIFKYAIMSNCHILEKRNCPSVMYHPLNYVILLPDLHYKWDNQTWEEREKWSCWPIVRDRLVSVYQDLDPSEMRYFPESVIKYIESKQPF